MSAVTLDARALALLERIQGARRSRHSLDADGADVDLATAYRVQAALGEQRRLKGYKIARFDGGAATGGPARPRAQDRGDTRVHGRIHADMLLAGRVSLGRFLRPRLACRLAAVLGDDVPAGAHAGQVELALGALLPAVEITDSVWASGAETLVGTVADNASAGAFVVAERLLSPPLAGSATLWLRGREAARCPLEAFGDLAERLAWLAGEVGGLAAGQVVCLAPEPDAPVAATPGPLALCGPDGSVLAVELTA